LADLFLARDLRLGDWHRSLMTALLDRLVRSIEDELRSSLAATFAAPEHADVHTALVAPRVEIALPILVRSTALRDPELVALLFRRVEEHRIYRAARMAPDPAESLVQELIRDEDQQISAAAMALLIGHSRRLDRFQEPMIASPELPAEIEHRLVWTVAAALRTWLVGEHGIPPAVADRALAAAATQRIYAYDEGEGLEARSLALARRLDALGRLTDAFIARTLAEGILPLFLAAFALRCDLVIDAVWEMLSDPRGRGLPLLLRAAGFDRAEAGQILVALGDPDDDEQLVASMGLFDRTQQAEALADVRFWQIDPVYRSAVAQVVANGRGRVR
jgi:uncharacterized protein (DUF2336 family)